MAIAVTPDNFSRAETDVVFSTIVHDAGLGRFEHRREVMRVDHQTVIRGNRDTLYSLAVFDLDAGPVTVTLPHAGTRFMSMQVIDEDQYVHAVAYSPGTYIFTREWIGTRYMMIAIRIMIDPREPGDVAAVHELQDSIRVSQLRTGTFDVPHWDRRMLKKLHDALLVIAETIPDSRRMFGARDAVDPVRHLIGTAMAWGGNPEHDARYLHVTPDRNDGRTIYRLTVRDVPVDGFWSISVYNAHGYFVPNRADAYSVNNITARHAPDGAVHIQFGGTSTDARVNVLPITRGWNYLVRLYRPRREVLDGTWTFPAPERGPQSLEV